MKKILLIALAVAIGFCMPLAAQAKVEFELGGYIRLDAVWSSQQSWTSGFGNYPPRDNVLNANHGKFQMNANATRFNLTMKGPELWGGKVTGFIEVDFDGGAGAAVGTTGVTVNNSSFNQAALRLRHAMFKINWPYNELIFGQYWSVNSELIPDVADSGAFCYYGSTQFRLPQVRWTHKFNDFWNGSVEIASPQNGRWGLNVNSADPLEGELGEAPMIEGKIRFEKDIYGKGAWYGKPRGFYVGLGAGWFRSYNQGSNVSPYTAWNTLGQNNFFAFNALLNAISRVNNKYNDHWIVQIENVTPIIPTYSKSLAGTLTLAHQWFIGQGLSAWRLDLPNNDRYYTFANRSNGGLNLDYKLNFIKRYGGHAQLQYYWTEEIYTNINFGFEKSFGFNGMRRNGFLAGFPGFFFQPGYEYANGTAIDPINSSWRASITQWYRPVPAVKFALQYAYLRANYFQYTTIGSNATYYGNVHTVMANAWYMF
jgi:hypothetical protein